jgi:hypothetical protein|tara:strand:+ start:376 stop:750 length:375 start_codon:yes stop_codon:yes gene_type:complete
MAQTNLPVTPAKKGSDSDVKNFFNQYFTEKLSFPSNDVDAVIGFFESRDFERTAAISVATALLEQAKIDDVKVFKLLDTLKGLDNVQLSVVVGEVLNFNRSKTSTLGFKRDSNVSKLEQRNVKV